MSRVSLRLADCSANNPQDSKSVPYGSLDAWLYHVGRLNHCQYAYKPEQAHYGGNNAAINGVYASFGC